MDLTNLNERSAASDRRGLLQSSSFSNGLGQRLSQSVAGTVTTYLLDTQPGLVQLLAATTSMNMTRSA